jgi:hypothetical protein
VQGIRPGSSGRVKEPEILVKRSSYIAALFASVALAYAGAAQASPIALDSSSPPAPLRVTASPRHSAAGASATATHAVRSRHHRHFRHRPAEKAQLRARVPWSATGAPPSQPVRRPIVPRHAAIRPASHERSHARNRTSGHGSAALVSRLSPVMESGRCSSRTLDERDARVESGNSGRGPPRAPPTQSTSVAPPRILGSDISLQQQHHPTSAHVPRPGPGIGPSVSIAARSGRSVPTVSRDRLKRRPHANRPEGAVVCHGMPSYEEIHT